MQVLLLLPMRNMAYRLVNRLLALAQKETRTDSVQGKSRFLEDFGPEEGAGPSKAVLEAQRGRPLEHTALFTGNSDDHFRLGIKLTRSHCTSAPPLLNSTLRVVCRLALLAFLCNSLPILDQEFRSLHRS